MITLYSFNENLLLTNTDLRTVTVLRMQLFVITQNIKCRLFRITVFVIFYPAAGVRA